MNRREFLQVLAVAAAGGLSLDHRRALAADPAALYDLPPFGQVSLLHMTDCHAQLLPIRYREPHMNLGLGTTLGQPPHLVGEQLLRHFRIPPGGAEAHAFTYLNYEAAALTYGRVGGFAHLARTTADACRMRSSGQTARNYHGTAGP